MTHEVSLVVYVFRLFIYVFIPQRLLVLLVSRPSKYIIKAGNISDNLIKITKGEADINVVLDATDSWDASKQKSKTKVHVRK